MAVLAGGQQRANNAKPVKEYANNFDGNYCEQRAIK